MDGVPSHEDPALVPSGCPPGTEAIPGVADHRGVVRADIPRLEEPPRGGLLVERLEGLAGEAHELPTPPARAARDHGGGPAGVAYLEVRGVEDPRLVEGDVHNQPVEEETPVVEGHPEQIAHRAVGTVATHDVLRFNALTGATVRWLDLDPGTVAVLTGVDRSMAPQEGEALGGLHPVEEPGLEVGLVEHVGRRPALPALRRRLEAEQWHALAVAPLVGRGRLGEGGQILPRPQAWRIRAVSSSKCTARGSG